MNELAFKLQLACRVDFHAIVAGDNGVLLADWRKKEGHFSAAPFQKRLSSWFRR
jgi:hypothetical protein